MNAIYNLEVTVRNQNIQIEEMQKSLINVIKNSNKPTFLYTHFEVFIIVVVVAVLQALFLYYK